tara:strand:- start:219 stop:653 length:435 start_codon:yes stop_codon:yes gene_type:complete
MIFNWVLIKKLAVGTAPRNKEDMIKLSQNNIISILSLCSEEEVKPPEDIELKFNCKRIILPDHSYGRNPTVEELEKTLFLLKELLENPPVFVHCVASIERSPLVCLGWLVKYNRLNPQEAMQYLMDIHPSTNPLPGQFNLLSKI